MAYLDPGAVAARTGREVAGAPVAGTDEVQTVTVTGTPTGGSFKLSFKGQKTAAIAYDADAAAIDTALEALATIGTGNVTVAGAGPFTATFVGALAKKAVPLLVLANNDLTGGTTPTVTIVETTPGVSTTHRGSPKGALVTDTTNGKLYINTGTATVPTWTVVGSQS